MQFSTLITIGFAAFASAAQIQIKVGDGGLKFSPNSVTASEGDVLQFVWASSDHDVVSGDYDSPCQPNNKIASPVLSPGSTDWYVTVNSTDTMWIYCSVSDHCKLGMSMVVNPSDGSSETLNGYQLAAIKASSGEPDTVEGGSTEAPTSAASSMASGSSSMSPSMASGSSTMSPSMTSPMASSMSSASAASPTSSGAAPMATGGVAGAIAVGLVGLAAAL